MTLAGLIFMLVSWTVIIGLFIFCMVRTLRPSKQDDDQSHQPKTKDIS